MEFVNILLQIEAKPVKKMRLHFFSSAVIANSNGQRLIMQFLHRSSKRRAYRKQG